MENLLEKEVEKKYTILFRKAAIISIVLFLILALILAFYYKASDSSTGYSLKCFENKTVCTENMNCQNITPTASEVEDCLRRG